ncbi:MAG: Ger(x)C family spore germination protein [Firmicutes bacterium]|nr:Ger(x)C family spore germination protein [Bacillota bacterium]
MRLKLGCLLLLALAVMGCWDFEEVDRRAFATTIGIDPAAGGKVRLTVQVPILTGGRGGAVGGGESGFYTLIQTARTVNEAFAALQTKTGRDLVIQQNKVIVLGATAARAGVKSLIDYLRRNPKAPPQSLVFIARGKSAAAILSFVPPKEILPASELILAGQTVPKADRVYFIPLWEFVQKLVHQSKDPYAPLIGVDRREKCFVFSGMAVFAGDRLAGTLDEEESQAFGLLANLMKAGALTFTTAGRRITLRNVKGRTRIAVREEDGRPSFHFKTVVYAALGEDTAGRTGLTPADYRRLEEEATQALRPRLEAVVKKLQNWEADVIDCGETLRAYHQRLWVRVKSSWRKVYRQALTTVEVKVHLARDGSLR